MNFDIAIASRTLWGEFRGEGEAGLVAGAWAIINRHAAGKWFSGQTLTECCMMHAHGSQYGQFSCWNVNDPNYPQILRLADDDALLQECTSYIMDAMVATGTDPTDGATHYFADSVQTPTWATNAIFTVQIGHTKFYKGVT